MRQFRPKYVTFDCYGTLTYFQMTALARERFAGRIAPEQLDAFVKDFSAYRFDEVLGAWKPYEDVIADAAIEQVRALRIRQCVVPGSTKEIVITKIPLDHVIPISPIQHIAARLAVDRVVAA